MPVGQFDKRRNGHRCTACSQSHLRCDRNQPCSNCIRRSVACSFIKPPAELQMVYVAPASSPGRALIESSWRFRTICFDTIGLMPQGAILRSESVIAMSQTDENVSRIMAVFGVLYASRVGPYARYAKQRQGLIRLVMRLKAPLRERMSLTTPGWWSTSTLTCGLIIALMDMLIDQTGDLWEPWVSTIGDYIARRVHDGTTLLPLEEELIRFFQLSDILSSVTRFLNPLRNNFESSVLSTPTTLPRAADASPSANGDHLLSVLYKWALLQHNMVKWNIEATSAGGAGDDGSGSRQLTAEHRARGIEILCEASALQLDMLGLHPEASSTDRGDSALLPYYSWPLVGISQLLGQTDSWNLLGCELPMLDARNLRQQARTMLEHVEVVLSQNGPSTAFYMPLVYAAGLELRSDEERKRIIRLFDDPRASSYRIRCMYRRNLLGTWERVDKEDAKFPSDEGKPIQAATLNVSMKLE